MSMGYLRSHPRLLTLFFATLLLTLDQVTKQIALSYLTASSTTTGFLRFELRKNPGAGFSLLTDSTLALTTLSSLALITILALLPRLLRSHHPLLVALALGGVAGNLTDRYLRSPSLFKGHVVDFVAVGSFPVFNLADVFLTTATGIFVISQLKGSSTLPAGKVSSAKKPLSTGTAGRFEA